MVPIAPVRVEVKDGWFQRVTLTNPDGKAVAGALNRDRTSFNTTEPLGYGVSYTWAGSVVGHDGKAVPVAGKFTTVNPDTQVNGQFQLADGQVVGVAGAGHHSVRRVDHRQGRRREGAEGHHRTAGRGRLGVAARRGGRFAGALPHQGVLPGRHQGQRRREALRRRRSATAPTARQDISLNFAIGRRQVVKADASSHRIQVITDEGVIMDFPCSYGEADQPRNITRSGIHVVTEKYEDFYMSNPAGGYTNAHERFAVRISNNGEFIHANPASSGAQGNTNVTNGCINLSTSDAQQYFSSAIYGDPVEVTGTSIELSYADGDLWDWAVSWDDWVAMSALSPQSSPSEIPATAPVHAVGRASARQRATWRLKREALAWSRGRITIRSRSTCDGRDATNPITSATSSATSGVTPS